MQLLRYQYYQQYMDIISVNLELKGFKQLLNGLNQIVFGAAEDAEGRLDQLQQKVYKNTTLDPAEVRSEITLFESIIKKAAQENWSVDELQQFLSSKSFAVDYTLVFTKFWAKESAQIHASLLRKATFQDSMEKVSWRVDMQAMSKGVDDINEPVAYFELDLANKSTYSRDQSAVKLKLNRQDVGSMLEKLNVIQLAIDNVKASKK